ncbi:MAG: AAA family ATPase, partial [Planctomycetota bacterium]
DLHPELDRLFDGEELVELQDLVRRVPVAGPVYERAVDLVRATRPGVAEVPEATRYLQWGAGPRAGQMLIIGGKARALLRGRFHVTTDDIDALAAPVLRHRVVTTFAAQAAGLDPDLLIERIIAHLARERDG